MIGREPDLEVIALAEGYGAFVLGGGELSPTVAVSDIRMPPNFPRDGVDGCKEIGKQQPGAGVVIQSHRDVPDCAIPVVSDGAVGHVYLRKHRIVEADQPVADEAETIVRTRADLAGVAAPATMTEE